jgi:hypothetical protein
MPRPRRRVCLQEGLHLDLNQLARDGFIRRGMRTDPRNIQWIHPYQGEIASGFVSADMSCAREGWLYVRIGNFNQLIALEGQPRRFGGQQWYFVCPLTKRPVSVVWKPAGAQQFCSRQAWGSQVAYLSQFGSPVDRAHLGKARIETRWVANSHSEKQGLPPKPKWMRWATYDRHIERYQRYEKILDYGCALIAAKSLERFV